MGADIVKRALPYSLKLIAANAGDNGSVVMQRIIENDDPNFGYNAATGAYEDLMKGGIIDPAKVRLCVSDACGCVVFFFCLCVWLGGWGGVGSEAAGVRFVPGPVF
jgi:chaperonin GroEL